MLDWVKLLVIGPDETELYCDAVVLEFVKRYTKRVTRLRYNQQPLPVEDIKGNLFE